MKNQVQELPALPVQMTDLCQARGVAIEATFVKRTKREEWECFEWSVTLVFEGRRYTTPYYCGLAHVSRPKPGDRDYNRHAPIHEQHEKPVPPSVADVVSSLCLDATSADRTTFEHWCSDLGYDTDSRKAEKTYHACVEINAKLRAFLGTHFDEFALAEH